MATSWLIREDLTELRRQVEERIGEVPLPPGVRFKDMEFREDTTGDPSMYLYFFVSTKYELSKKRLRQLNELSFAVAERIFEMKTGRFPYIDFIEEA